MAIVRVQGNARGTSTSNSISVTLASTPTNGNVLIATMGLMSTYALPSVLSISQTGVTWTKQIAKPNSTYYLATEIWLGVVGSGASTAITINLNTTCNYGAVADVCEYSGIKTSNFLDKTATNMGNSQYPDTGTTDTTTQADELWIGSTMLSMYAQTTPKNGFTLLDGAYYTYTSEAFLEKIVSSTGQANSGTTGGGSSGWAGCIATFFAAGGAPPAAAGILVQVI